MEQLSEPLALFLEALLENISTVRVVPDNFRGLGEENAENDGDGAADGDGESR